MKISLNDIQTQFRAQGLKCTPQRAAIFEALCRSTAHPTAEDLYDEVAPRYPMLSLNTVYYTLGVLRKAGLVREVNVGHLRARFDANLSPHHHLICRGCQAIVDVVDNRLNRLATPKGLPSGFAVTDHQVTFHGFCGKCRTRSTSITDQGITPQHKGGFHGKKSQGHKKSRQPQSRLRG